MAQPSETLPCPKGHLSTEADYCSECGTRLQGPADVPITAGTLPAGEVCPDCGTAREQNEISFCEVCGYNFLTGAHGEVGIMPVAEAASEVEVEKQADVVESSPPDETPITPALHWSVVVLVDPALGAADSPAAPVDVEPVSIDLEQPVCLIGRRDEARGIFPEVALAHDEAVSRRHALLQHDPAAGLLLRDIGAANGTRLNGVDLEPMVDYPLKDGDEITLGHWSRLRVHGHSTEVA